MAASRDVDDARHRATRALQHFEGEVRKGCEVKNAAAQGQLSAALRENALLKRAVAIQNTRHQARAAVLLCPFVPAQHHPTTCHSLHTADNHTHPAPAQEFAQAASAENEELKKQLARAQADLHAANMTNYSLSLHLREALSQQPYASQRNSDVF